MTFQLSPKRFCLLTLIFLLAGVIFILWHGTHVLNSNLTVIPTWWIENVLNYHHDHCIIEFEFWLTCMHQTQSVLKNKILCLQVTFYTIQSTLMVKTYINLLSRRQNQITHFSTVCIAKWWTMLKDAVLIRQTTGFGDCWLFNHAMILFSMRQISTNLYRVWFNRLQI